MPGNVARSMIGRKMVREVKAEESPSAPQLPMTASLSAPMDRMLALPGREHTNAPRTARRR
jgi:hypothetical protein